jgi:hypothetical protein
MSVWKELYQPARRKKVVITLKKVERIQDFMNWYLNNIFLYGNIWEEWWNKKGLADFIKWEKQKHGKNCAGNTAKS